MSDPPSHVDDMPSDYDRSIQKSYKQQIEQTRSSASGKKVPQLGEQEIQSIPPLKVFPDISVAQFIGGADIPRLI